MKGRIACGILVLLGAAVTAPAQEPARVFIEEMLRGVGAREISCPSEIRDAIEVRAMEAVCARYDGDFGAFQSAWSLFLLDDVLREGSGQGRRIPYTLPQTAWEVRDGGHERIYAVGKRAVGVRFDAGAVMMVYKGQ